MLFMYNTVSVQLTHTPPTALILLQGHQMAMAMEVHFYSEIPSGLLWYCRGIENIEIGLMVCYSTTTDIYRTTDNLLKYIYFNIVSIKMDVDSDINRNMIDSSMIAMFNQQYVQSIYPILLYLLTQ